MEPKLGFKFGTNGMYVFRPTEDIEAYELAQIVILLFHILSGEIKHEDAMSYLTNEIRQHFVYDMRGTDDS